MRGWYAIPATLLIILFASINFSACVSLSRIQAADDTEIQVSLLDYETQLRTHIPAEVEKYLGMPYSYGAKGPHEFDCSGFTSHVLRSFDIALLGSSMSQAKQGRSVKISEAQPGDIIYFTNPSGRVNHVAIVVSNDSDGLEVVHATTSRGVVRENISNSSYWAPRIAGARCVVECRSDMVSAY